MGNGKLTPDPRESVNLKLLTDKALVKQNQVKRLIRIEEKALNKLKEIKERSRALIMNRMRNLEYKQEKYHRTSQAREKEHSQKELNRQERETSRNRIEYGKLQVYKRNRKIAKKVREGSERFVEHSLPCYQYFRCSTFKPKTNLFNNRYDP